MGALPGPSEPQVDLLVRLTRDYSLPREVADLFHYVRRVGNAASHDRRGDHATALSTLKVARQLSVWFHRSFGDPQYKAGPFQPPKPPEDSAATIQDELERLRAEFRDSLSQAERKAVDAEQRARLAEAARLNAEERSLKEAEDRAVWEKLAAEAEANAIARLQALRREVAALPEAALRKRRIATEAAAANLNLDEKATRSIIDAQLRNRGWEADSENLRYSKGSRPVKGRNTAIAEWPTANGPADYALFIGTTCVAIVEAKRRNKNVSDRIDQAGRYSQGFHHNGCDLVSGAPWAAERKHSQGAVPFRVPFLFSTNGRPYLKQIETQSGIWFRDTREPTNIRRALTDWPTPEGLLEQIGTNRSKALAELEAMPFDFGFDLRDYQERAIRAVEQTLYDDGKRTMLVAMATGTGKTKISIALLYRLLTTGRFRRVCFVVIEGRWENKRRVSSKQLASSPRGRSQTSSALRSRRPQTGY